MLIGLRPHQTETVIPLKETSTRRLSHLVSLVGWLHTHVFATRSPLGGVGGGGGIAQWLEHQTYDQNVACSSPCRSSGRIFFSRVNFLCWHLFWYPFHTCVTAAGHKRSQPFSQNCRWQVTAKYACTLYVWFCMKWHGAWLYGETAAASHGTSHASAVSTPLRWIFKNAL